MSQRDLGRGTRTRLITNQANMIMWAMWRGIALELVLDISFHIGENIALVGGRNDHAAQLSTGKEIQLSQFHLCRLEWRYLTYWQLLAKPTLGGTMFLKKSLVSIQFGSTGITINDRLLWLWGERQRRTPATLAQQIGDLWYFSSISGGAGPTRGGLLWNWGKESVAT